MVESNRRRTLRRALSGTLIALILGSCAGRVNVSPSDVAAARDNLRPIVAEEQVELAIAACLTENGVTAFVPDPEGGFVGRHVTARDQEILEDCRKDAFSRFDWPPPQPETASEYRVIYDLYSRMADCLEGLGFDIRMPTFEVYYESHGDWFPYSDLPVPSSDEDWQLWNTTCPQDPWAYDEEIPGS